MGKSKIWHREMDVAKSPRFVAGGCGLAFLIFVLMRRTDYIQFRTVCTYFTGSSEEGDLSPPARLCCVLPLNKEVGARVIQ
jgi:hypothetical protein